MYFEGFESLTSVYRVNPIRSTQCIFYGDWTTFKLDDGVHLTNKFAYKKDLHTYFEVAAVLFIVIWAIFNCHVKCKWSIPNMHTIGLHMMFLLC